MDLLEAESRMGRTVIATTHDLATAAERFQRVAAINHRVIAEGPASLILDPDLLAKTYGGHLLVVGGNAVVIDDAHHHDQPSGREVHYHEDTQRH